MQTIKVEIPQTAFRSYPIFIGSNIIEECGSYIKDYIRAKNLLIVSNTTIYSLYGEKVKKSFIDAGFEANFLLLNDGEQYKNINSLENIWSKAIELKLERSDAIIALGGGVIGDITGFAAATYLRGVDFIQIPTTLLAQVDSSVGGKVAVNHHAGKNLIGNFYQPKAVLTDVKTLNTLPFSELKVGLAEVLKYGFIEKSCGLNGLNMPFMDYLKVNKDLIISLEQLILEETVKYCCELKAAVVNQDEKEAGLRAILNFGHTTGHAIEKCYNYKNINHGEAVAIGMRAVFLLAREKGLISNKYYDESIDLLDKYGMDYKIDKNISPDTLYKAMQVDKKIQSGKIRFVLPVGKAKVEIFKDITEKDIINALKFLYSG